MGGEFEWTCSVIVQEHTIASVWLRREVRPGEVRAFTQRSPLSVLPRPILHFHPSQLPHIASHLGLKTRTSFSSLNPPSVACPPDCTSLATVWEKADACWPAFMAACWNRLSMLIVEGEAVKVREVFTPCVIGQRTGSRIFRPPGCDCFALRFLLFSPFLLSEPT